ncbi:hypothetical protein [Gordonia sp. NPDC003422]
MHSISLYCDRGHDRTELGRLVHHDSLGPSWTLEGNRKAVQILDENNTRTSVATARPDEVLSRRYRICCDCGQRVVVRDDHRLWSCLAQLADNNVAELRLAELHSALRFSRAQC